VFALPSATKANRGEDQQPLPAPEVDGYRVAHAWHLAV
jgi:hypothetical protein